MVQRGQLELIDIEFFSIVGLLPVYQYPLSGAGIVFRLCFRNCFFGMIVLCHARAGMAFLIDAAHARTCDVRVYLRCGDIDMAEHFLNGAQVRAALEQMRRGLGVRP